MDMSHAGGTLVHFVLDVGPNAGTHRPAMVVAGTKETCNLVVFLDGPNDGYGGSEPETRWRESVAHDEAAKAPGTWHWPEAEDEAE